MLLRHHNMMFGLHPKVRQSLEIGLANSFALPSQRHILLLDQFVRGLDSAFILSRLEFLYVEFLDSGTRDFGKINIARPSFALATGTPNYTSGLGIGNGGGNFDTGFKSSDFILGTVGQDHHLMAYVKQGGANSSLQDIVGAQDASFATRISMRTNPRQDCVPAGGIATPFTINSAASANNTMYSYEKETVAAVTTLYTILNGTRTSQGVSGAGNFPPGISWKIGGGANGNLIAGRYMGIASMGGSMGATRWSAYNTLIQAFSAAL